MADWQVQNGVCTRVSQEELMEKGSGIFIVRYLDLLTRMLAPRFEYGCQESTAQDYYLMLGLELLTGKLLNHHS